MSYTTNTKNPKRKAQMLARAWAQRQRRGSGVVPQGRYIPGNGEHHRLGRTDWEEQSFDTGN